MVVCLSSLSLSLTLFVDTVDIIRGLKKKGLENNPVELSLSLLSIFLSSFLLYSGRDSVSIIFLTTIYSPFEFNFFFFFFFTIVLFNNFSCMLSNTISSIIETEKC